MDWNDENEFLNRLPKKHRQDIKREVLKNEYKYEVEFTRGIPSSDLEHYYHLYLEVYNRSLQLNTFSLPYKLFEQISRDPNWEIMTLKLKPEYNDGHKINVAVTFSYVTENNYNAMILGMDYSFLEEFKCYKQNIYQLIKRTKDLNIHALQLGYSASQVKRKFGATIISSVAYMQTRDNYSMEVISTINAMGEVHNK